ncbi:MAG: hypothetical protein EAZ85_02915 [Bacteroidetes bacterium]|nr:MAG: hypothetical protein EAZ85_02915 [Bacteroidota bacterium]TAG85370.1 MAG: hypothetical protein EAZ20_15315 [Bacteroidota bacterium]
MASVTFFSPKSFLFKIADMFQKPAKQNWEMPADETFVNADNENVTSTTNTKAKSKLNVNLSDLKLISTALLQYRRTLAKQGLGEKAEDVARIDRQFYELISNLENSDND